MTNETTASQPKSIGDDARCSPLQFLHNVCADATRALRNAGNKQLASLLEIALKDLPVAPAAQASATIQAAPEVMSPERVTEIWSKVADEFQLALRHAIDPADAGNLTVHFARAVERYVRLAATIQEPVMVAEPVGEAKPYSCETGQIDEALADFLAEHTRLNQDGIDTHAMNMTLALNYAAITPTPDEEIAEWREQGYLPDAAPMVADPAGLADAAKALLHVMGGNLGKPCEWQFAMSNLRTAIAASKVEVATSFALPSEMPSQWLSEVVGPSVDDLSYGQGYRAGWNDCRVKFIAYFATVKAVPSEAQK